MDPVAALAIIAVALVVIALGALTSTGARRRHANVGTAVVSGVFFPVTWFVWYVRDTPRHG